MNEESTETMTAAELIEKRGLLKIQAQAKNTLDACKPHAQPRPMRMSRSGMKGTRNKRQHQNTATDEQKNLARRI